MAVEAFEKYDWIIEAEEATERIDKFLSEQFEEWSRSQIQQWIKEGNVTVNGRMVKANYKIQEDDEVVLQVPPQKELNIEPESIPLDIVYEDQDVIVINKPRGMVVHPAPGHYSGTLVNALLYHCKDLSGINGVLRPGIVHRIDKDTSGLLMAAKNDLAHESLARQLKDHDVHRIYLALVHGEIPHDLGTIDAPIGRDPHDRKKMTVIHKNSKHAVTHFVVKERFQGFTLVECKLETGRTHQIRVHMQYIGHPLVGDPLYGLKKTLKIDGQALHAKTLGFKHPRTNEYMEFDSELPEDMQGLIEELRANR
ncbi:RluA family pseudouridine synthase [Tepidibacillus decaturensis]|uniref:Pseudouridine synthase n=1 Tax=Tepidibacillus decaturensis TaxID=1413211 RepID=A0A135L473_9BACI|nr:RluA family pseudouridine synthase [Tepidibacillus decaturensis]KXG43741.1 pseudouridine synthase [Tepidibacillus decaturensis]